MGKLYSPKLVGTLDSLLARMSKLPHSEASWYCFQALDVALSEHMRLRIDERHPMFDRFWARLTDYTITDVGLFEETQKKLLKKDKLWVLHVATEMDKFLLDANNRWFRSKSLVTKVFEFAKSIFADTYHANETMSMGVALKRALAHKIIRSIADTEFSTVFTVPFLDDCTLCTRDTIDIPHLLLTDTKIHIVHDLSSCAPPILKPTAVLQRFDYDLLSRISNECRIQLLDFLKKSIVDTTVEEGSGVKRMFVEAFASLVEYPVDAFSRLSPFDKIGAMDIETEQHSLKDSAMLAWYLQEVIGDEDSCFLLKLLDGPVDEIPLQIVPNRVFNLISTSISTAELFRPMLDILHPLVLRLCKIAALFWFGTSIRKSDSISDKAWGTSTDNKALATLCTIAQALARQQSSSSDPKTRKLCASYLVQLERTVCREFLEPLLDPAIPNVVTDALPFVFSDLDSFELSSLFRLLTCFLRHLPAQAPPNAASVLFSHPEPIWPFFLRLVFISASGIFLSSCHNSPLFTRQGL